MFYALITIFYLIKILRICQLKDIYKQSVKNCCSYLTTLVSGSPIVQDGRLVGAVTHVLIGDPTTGYGNFIENMLANMAAA